MSRRLGGAAVRRYETVGPDTPSVKLRRAVHLQEELEKARLIARRDAAFLALLCRSPATTPAQLVLAAGAVTLSAGRLAAFATLLTR
jgi:hypothetical protein